MAPPTSLIRPSELARFWGLHPKTVYLWMRTGKLAAVRTPGGQFRVDPSVVAELAHAHGLPVPPFVGSTKVDVLVVAGAAAWREALRRGLKPAGVAVRRIEDPYEGFVAAASAPPDVLIVGPSDGFDVPRAVKALRKLLPPRAMRIALFGDVDEAERARLAGVQVVAPDGESSTRALVAFAGAAPARAAR